MAKTPWRNRALFCSHFELTSPPRGQQLLVCILQQHNQVASGLFVSVNWQRWSKKCVKVGQTCHKLWRWLRMTIDDLVKLPDHSSQVRSWSISSQVNVKSQSFLRQNQAQSRVMTRAVGAGDCCHICEKNIWNGVRAMVCYQLNTFKVWQQVLQLTLNTSHLWDFLIFKLSLKEVRRFETRDTWTNNGKATL